jgi:hypothetical protein
MTSGTKLLILLMIKQQVNKPPRILDLRGLVSCQAIEVPSNASQILLSVTPVMEETVLRDHKMYRDQDACAGACARICRLCKGAPRSFSAGFSNVVRHFRLGASTTTALSSLPHRSSRSDPRLTCTDLGVCCRKDASKYNSSNAEVAGHNSAIPITNSSQ